jgi:hypothetical protein
MSREGERTRGMSSQQDKLYIAQSRTTSKTTDELAPGKWFIGWFMFFSKTLTSKNPSK